MVLQDKIEEIRRKPEHIRLRYVYALTAISLAMIIIIWFISIKAQNTQTPDSSLEESAGGIINSLTEQKKSLEGAALDVKGAIDQAKQLPGK